jgi:hypothetical protein
VLRTSFAVNFAALVQDRSHPESIRPVASAIRKDVLSRSIGLVVVNGFEYIRHRYRYTRGPFEEGVPEQGYQAAANPRQIYRGLKSLAGSDSLSTAEQEQALTKVQHS